MNPTPHPRKKAIPRIVPLLCAVACLLLTAMACQKKDLPEPTQDGRNSFGCKINGEVYLRPKHRMFASNPPFSVRLVRLGDGREYLAMITSTDQSGNMGNLKISYTSYETLNIGDYIPVSSERGDGFAATYWHKGKEYHIDIENPNNKVAISRLDREQKIIAGTFQFRLVDHLSGDRIEVTEGRFDVTFPYP